MCAWIEGTARRLVTDTTVTDADAVAELKALAAGRADLLAEVAGVSLGFSGDDPTKYVTRRIEELCIAAGADQDEVPHWIAVGQSGAEHAKAVPST
jgi:hypothetical protein